LPFASDSDLARAFGKGRVPSNTKRATSPAGPRVLLTSICRPIGAAHGDATSVSYEVLHGQVTRAQGVFSPRSTNYTFALDYIAENLDAPATVLHYPSHRELIRELRKGPTHVGVSFNLSTFQRMKEAVALVRRHAPQAKVVLGGYGTVVDDAMLAPFADHVCRGEGVSFFRELLGEPPRPMPYDHPLVVHHLRVFSVPVQRTGMIFAGLGCPHGCDFCCTSHFFKRRHIRLLPTGDDIYRVIERYQEMEPGMGMAIIDEDFLIARDRAVRLRELILERGRPLSIFAFATVKALSRMTPRELLETGIDGVWVGYEGKRSGFAKQQGRPVEELIPELRSHGITVLSSMIVGFDYQTPEVIREELAEFLALKPTYAQFLIYGPTPGTPFFERVMREGRLHRAMAENPEGYYRKCDGFTSMVRHPSMSAGEIESLQRECFETDFHTLGPSLLRSVETWFAGWKRYRDSDSPYLRAKAACWAEEIRRAYPLFPVAKRSGPTPEAAARLEGKVKAALGPPDIKLRCLCMLAPFAAAWTGFTLRHDRFQHPKLRRVAFRSSPWALRTGNLGSLRVDIERALRTTRVRLEGAFDQTSARSVAKGILSYLHDNDAQVRVVIADGTQATREHLRILGKTLARQRHRISVAIPSAPDTWSQLAQWLDVMPSTA
jgi:radical SAM superfamily enzyme YgiQ (UPF0313 family)